MQEDETAAESKVGNYSAETNRSRCLRARLFRSLSKVSNYAQASCISKAALKYFQVTIQRHGRTFPWAFGHTNGSGQDFVHVRPSTIRRNAALDDLQPLYVSDTNNKKKPTSLYTTVANLSYASAVANAVGL